MCFLRGGNAVLEYNLDESEASYLTGSMKRGEAWELSNKAMLLFLRNFLSHVFHEFPFFILCSAVLIRLSLSLSLRLSVTRPLCYTVLSCDEPFSKVGHTSVHAHSIVWSSWSVAYYLIIPHIRRQSPKHSTPGVHYTANRLHLN